MRLILVYLTLVLLMTLLYTQGSVYGVKRKLETVIVGFSLKYLKCVRIF